MDANPPMEAIRAEEEVMKSLKLLAIVSLSYFTPAPIYGQVTNIDVVNMIPNEESEEVFSDIAPNLTVNPAIPSQMAATVNAGNVLNGGLAPIIISDDNGDTWHMRRIIPTPPGPFAFITNPIALEFSPTNNVLYAVLSGLKENVAPPMSSAKMTVFRTFNFLSSVPMQSLVELNDKDVIAPTQGFLLNHQPWIAATTISGNHRVYIGFNDNTLNSDWGGSGRTASIAQSLNGFSIPIFNKVVIESRDNVSGENLGAIRPAAAGAPNQTVYAAFFGLRLLFAGGNLYDRGELVIVRDDNGGAGNEPFTDLQGDDGRPGKVVAVFRDFPFQRLGVPTNLSIAVDPNPGRSNRIYVAWVDATVPGDLLSATPSPKYALHVRHSLDGGENWSLDIKSVPNAMNPSIAINRAGEVGLLYQQVIVGDDGRLQCETRVELTNGAFSRSAGSSGGFVLARAPDILFGYDEAGNAFTPTCRAKSTDLHAGLRPGNFLGVFSASNTPDLAKFPLQGIVNDNIDYDLKYQRNHDFNSQTLLDANGSPGVAPSHDPFLFRLQHDLGPQPETRLTVKLDLVPANDLGRFSLHIDGVSVVSNAGDGAFASQTVGSGTHIVRTVPFGANTNDDDYFTRFKEYCTNEGSIVLDDGEIRTCSIEKRNKEWHRGFCDDWHESCLATISEPGSDSLADCAFQFCECYREIGERPPVGPAEFCPP